MLINLVGFWLLGMPVSLVLAFPLGLGPVGLWWGLAVGLGAVGVLQFDVAAHRLKGEYGVDAMVEAVGVQAARWVVCDDDKELKRFREKAHDNLAEDGDGQLVYLAPTRVNLNLTMERFPDVRFLATREL